MSSNSAKPPLAGIPMPPIKSSLTSADLESIQLDEDNLAAVVEDNDSAKSIAVSPASSQSGSSASAEPVALAKLPGLPPFPGPPPIPGPPPDPRVSAPATSSTSQVDMPAKAAETSEDSSEEQLREGELPLARESVESLTDLLADCYPYSAPPLAIGMQLEFPIVGLSGKCGDMGMLWSTLRSEGGTEHREANGMLSKLCFPKLNYSVGLGRGTLRLELAPQASLLELKSTAEDALLRLQPGLEQWKLRLLEYGSQPISAHNQSLLTQIYSSFSLLRRLKEPMLFLGGQAMCSISLNPGRQDLTKMLNWGHLLSPAVRALGQRSPIVGSKDCYFPSGRTAALMAISAADIGDGRWTMIESPYSALDEWVFHTLYQPHWLQRDHEGWLDPAEGLFGSRMLERDVIDIWEDYLDHLDTFWTDSHLLPRTAQLRLAQWEQCGVQLSFAIAALMVGLTAQHDEVTAFFETAFAEAPEKRQFGLRATDILRIALEHQKDIWSPMVSFNKSVLRSGLTTQEPCTGFWDGLLGYAERGLIQRGLGEETLLSPIGVILRERDKCAELRRTWILEGSEQFLSQLWLNEDH